MGRSCTVGLPPLVLAMLLFRFSALVERKVTFTLVSCYWSHQSSSHLLLSESLQNMILSLWNNCLHWVVLIIEMQRRQLLYECGGCLWEERRLCCLWSLDVLKFTLNHSKWIPKAIVINYALISNLEGSECKPLIHQAFTFCRVQGHLQRSL